MEYCKLEPPEAVTVIEPLFVPQPCGFDDCTFTMLGPAGEVTVTGFEPYAVWQDPSADTDMNTSAALTISHKERV